MPDEFPTETLDRISVVFPGGISEYLKVLLMETLEEFLIKSLQEIQTESLEKLLL